VVSAEAFLVFLKGDPAMFRGKVLILSIGITALFCAAGLCDDWAQWRGANRDGIWREEGIVERFETKQLAVRWRAKIAGGYSGPTVAEGLVYVTDSLTEPARIERVHCFDAMTGGEIWSHSYKCDYGKVGYRTGPRASVTIDEGRAYSLGTTGQFFCFDAKNGKVLWGKDLNAEYKIRMPYWGISGSPLIEEGLVIVQIGGIHLFRAKWLSGSLRRSLGTTTSLSAVFMTARFC